MTLSKKRQIDFSKPVLALAPMEGVVDFVTRDLITAFGEANIGAVDFCVTEFVRVSERLLPAKVFLQYCPELQTQSLTQAQTPVIVQLLGSHPELMAESAALAVSLGAFGIDLNFGCPAKTVNNHDGGAALLKTPERIHKVISAVRKSVPLEFSVSAKIRLGFDHKEAATEIAQAAEAAGSSWLTVHARTKTDGYKPPAYWEYIAKIHDTLKIPVLANGEVWTLEDYDRCRQVSCCEHVMIGRGWVANPGLGEQIKTRSKKTQWSTLQPFFLQFIDRSEEHRNSAYAVQRSKQLAKMMSQSFGEAHILFQKIKTLQELPALRQIVADEFLPKEEFPPEPKLIVANKLNATMIKN